MRAALLIGCLAVSGACGASSPGGGQGTTAGRSLAGSAAQTHLAITVYPRGGVRGGARRYSLQCKPARGTVPRPLRACRTLAGLAHPFAPVPPRTICAFIVLGPQEAHVTGVLRGARVDARLSLRDTCEIDRWRRVRTVVPGFSGA
jgi:Subtilisin inhibitor-like